MADGDDEDRKLQAMAEEGRQVAISLTMLCEDIDTSVVLIAAIMLAASFAASRGVPATSVERLFESYYEQGRKKLEALAAELQAKAAEAQKAKEPGMTLGDRARVAGMLAEAIRAAAQGQGKES
jgi:Skp family chaperone for outer membrane proteins